jgi:hypothetical protein
MPKTVTYLLIGGGVLVVAYLVFAPKSTLLKGSSSSSSSSLGGTMTGAGNLATGLSNLWDSVTSTFAGGSDETAE